MFILAPVSNITFTKSCSKLSVLKHTLLYFISESPLLASKIIKYISLKRNYGDNNKEKSTCNYTSVLSRHSCYIHVHETPSQKLTVHVQFKTVQSCQGKFHKKIKCNTPRDKLRISFLWHSANVIY